MRLQDLTSLASDIARVTIRQNEENEWEVSVFLGGAISTEHKITKYWVADVRSWKSLDKAVRTLEAVLGTRFERIEISLKKANQHEKADSGSS